MKGSTKCFRTRPRAYLILNPPSTGFLLWMYQPSDSEARQCGYRISDEPTDPKNPRRYRGWHVIHASPDLAKLKTFTPAKVKKALARQPFHWEIPPSNRLFNVQPVLAKRTPF